MNRNLNDPLVKSVTETVFKEFFSSFIPGFSAFHDISKAFIENAELHNRENAEARIHAFHVALLDGKTSGISQEDIQKFLDKSSHIDDYRAILGLCAKDVEKEKTEIYTTLMLSLLNSNAPEHMRRELILLANSLSANEIALLKKIYIHSKFKIMGCNSPKPNEHLINHFERHNVMLNKKISVLGDIFVEFVHSKEKLTPESIGQVSWSDNLVLIICYKTMSPRQTLVYENLMGALDALQIRSSVHTFDKIRKDFPFYLYNAAFILADEDEPKLWRLNSDAIKKFSSIKPVYKLNLNENILTVENIFLFKEFSLLATDPADIRKELATITNDLNEQLKK